MISEFVKGGFLRMSTVELQYVVDEAQIELQQLTAPHAGRLQRKPVQPSAAVAELGDRIAYVRGLLERRLVG